MKLVSILERALQDSTYIEVIQWHQLVALLLRRYIVFLYHGKSLIVCIAAHAEVLTRAYLRVALCTSLLEGSVVDGGETNVFAKAVCCV